MRESEFLFLSYTQIWICVKEFHGWSIYDCDSISIVFRYKTYFYSMLPNLVKTLAAFMLHLWAAKQIISSFAQRLGEMS